MRTDLCLAVCAGLLAACQDGPAFQAQKQTDSFQQSPTDEVDILFIVDNSGSMKAEQQLLATGFKSFISEIEATGANFHIGVITTDFETTNVHRAELIGTPPVITPDIDYEKAFEQRAVVGTDGDGKEKGLEAATYALSPAMSTGANAGFLRDEATLLVVIVSDEDDCSDNGALGENAANTDCYTKYNELVPVSTYVSQMTALKASPLDFKFAGIVGPENASSLCKKTTIPGHRYIEAARLTAGLTSSICESDWSDFLHELGLNAAGILTVFPLSYGADPGTLVVTVNGEAAPESAQDGYTYDEVGHSITFHGLWIPERGADVVITYTIQSGT